MKKLDLNENEKELFKNDLLEIKQNVNNLLFELEHKKTISTEKFIIGVLKIDNYNKILMMTLNNKRELFNYTLKK